MKVQPDFAGRLKGIADSTPREAIANLLRGLLPRTPVTTRPPAYTPTPTPAPYTAPMRDPIAPRRMVRVKWSKDDRAVITVLAKRNPYRWGTKAAATFDLFGQSPTVRDFRLLVAQDPDKYDAGYLRYSSRDGYIRIGE